MKNTITLTVGLQGSGKTTWANQQVDQAQGKTININKDDLRAMLHNKAHSKGREAFVLKVQEAIIDVALQEGNNVIVSDTNFGDFHIDRITEKFGKRAEIVVNDSFLEVSLDECLARDAARANPIGQKAIRETYNKYMKKPWVPLAQNTNLPVALIVDIDGTLAHMVNRGPFEWSRVGEDSVDDTVASLVRTYSKNGYKILITSGRDAACRKETKDWLIKNSIPFDDLFMRKAGDSRKDCVVKEEIFNTEIFDRYYVEFVVDDRDQVVKLWRSIGLKCFQVAEGNF